MAMPLVRPVDEQHYSSGGSLENQQYASQTTTGPTASLANNDSSQLLVPFIHNRVVALGLISSNGEQLW